MSWQPPSDLADAAVVHDGVGSISVLAVDEAARQLREQRPRADLGFRASPAPARAFPCLGCSEVELCRANERCWRSALPLAGLPDFRGGLWSQLEALGRWVAFVGGAA